MINILVNIFFITCFCTNLSYSLFLQIPLPTMVDDHQTKNAYIMADVMGAKVITEDELDSSSLRSIIDEVFGTWHLYLIS